jgi:hypothetical protein
MTRPLMLQLVQMHRLVEAGWTRGSFTSDGIDGGLCYCILGAAGMASQRDPRAYAANGLAPALRAPADALVRALEAEIVPADWCANFEPITRLTSFNDVGARSGADILALIDRAIATHSKETTPC